MDTLPISKLKPNPENPRTSLGDVSELVESILAFGIVEPLVVAPHGTHYLVVCGHRRVAAAKQAGLTDVPVVIRKMDASERELVALTENVHRRQLSPIEEAIAYARLMKRRGLTQMAVAKLMHVSDFTVSTRLALLRLPKDVIEQVDTGEMTIREALELERQSRRVDGQRKKKRGISVSRCKVAGHAGHGCEVEHATNEGGNQWDSLKLTSEG